MIFSDCIEFDLVAAQSHYSTLFHPMHVRFNWMPTISGVNPSIQGSGLHMHYEVPRSGAPNWVLGHVRSLQNGGVWYLKNTKMRRPGSARVYRLVHFDKVCNKNLSKNPLNRHSLLSLFR